jgi:hypothetical protein
MSAVPFKSATVVPVDRAILERIVEATPADGVRSESGGVRQVPCRAGKDRVGRRSIDNAFALVHGDRVLASAERYDLAGTLDGQPIGICAIAALFNGRPDDAQDHRGALVERLLEHATRNGADLALLIQSVNWASVASHGFEAVPTLDVELTVTESLRHGAPMTLVRAGEDRDLGAIADMGRIRAGQFRFHLDRDVDHIKHAITRKRLLAGLGAAGIRQLEFVIAEEGIPPLPTW